MHPCLAIPDIFRQICDVIRLRIIRTSHPQSDLASLARTCRTLSEIALDSLWYEIVGIGPLIRCMPRDLWEIDAEDQYQRSRPFLKRPLKYSDIHTLHKYTQRIRSFRPEYLTRGDSLVDAYRALSLASHDRLLPKLEQLAWHVDNAEIFPYIRFFFSPTLRVLDMTFDVHHSEQLGFLSAVPVLSPTIFKLKVALRDYTISSLNDPLVEGFSDALRAWHNLSDLKLYRVPLDGLMCAAQLPKLKRLSIHPAKISKELLPDLPNPLWDPPSASQLYYPALESLTLSCIPSVAIAVQFFEVLQSARLLSIELSFTAPSATLSHFHRFFSILAEHCSPSSLKVFQFTCRHPRFSFSDIVSPLLVFLELKEVRLRLASPMEFSEDQMTQVASSWPHLEVLEATGTAPVASQSHLQTTLACLVPLADGCPGLRELHLWIDASDAATRRALRADPGRTKEAQNWALRRLDVQNSPISHKEFVASFLSDIFPNLEDITPKIYRLNKNVESRNIQRWQHVAQVLLPMLSRARMKDYKRLSVAIPQTEHRSPYDLDTSFKHSARWFAEKVEEEDGEWSDPEQLVVTLDRVMRGSQ
ncbi:hypothetical protein P691DRAFT_775253 [Macrolepiota fuliginosa MF-IS2]|uniref:F-box domain-containing protein n=1 Tax=Macrolepiota fuliginosa MF-IS2 TaxID=1400762 RepID=A0A9P5XCW1_9AGAR|nr:hypothetical protein P691DRAFT_775253 [Macrolepiota fuliginosa MF-IS2]